MGKAESRREEVGASLKDHTKIPSVGTHVVITGTFVQDTNHSKWNEIHPVSSIKVQ